MNIFTQGAIDNILASEFDEIITEIIKWRQEINQELRDLLRDQDDGVCCI